MSFINVSYSGGPLLKKDDLSDYFKEESFSKEPREHYFLIREPFNHTYNPAKNFLLKDRLKL